MTTITIGTRVSVTRGIGRPVYDAQEATVGHETLAGTVQAVDPIYCASQSGNYFVVFDNGDCQQVCAYTNGRFGYPVTAFRAI